jgi:hypothetical protein
MQVENDYDKEVYNGDIGFVEDVGSDAGDLTASSLSDWGLISMCQQFCCGLSG